MSRPCLGLRVGLTEAALVLTQPKVRQSKSEHLSVGCLGSSKTYLPFGFVSSSMKPRRDAHSPCGEERKQVPTAVLWDLNACKEQGWDGFAMWICQPGSQCLPMGKIGWTKGLKDKGPQASKL